MSFFTDHDLECLARLKANWRQSYFGELKHLQNEDADKRWSDKTLGPHCGAVPAATPALMIAPSPSDRRCKTCYEKWKPE
ncbi:hypothetical protein ABIB80_007607 [Bradyrhizobium sp. i1.15.2]